MSQELSVVQSKYLTLAADKGFSSFIKLFELSGNPPDIAKALAEKEAYHLAQMIADNEDLAKIPTGALVMEIRKIPLQGVSLDPTLKLAYLLIQDKQKGKVSLEITGRGKAVQAIAQNIIKSINAEPIFEGDELTSHNGLLQIIPKMSATSKVIGGLLTIIWTDGRSTQDVYRQSHIDSWRNRSAKRFKTANTNYTSFNGGMEPGFIQSKMLKHKLDRIGINPFPGAYKKLNPEIINSLPEETTPQVIVDEPEHPTEQPSEQPDDNIEYTDFENL
jgi:recombinational DNA repair protein RecT